MRTIDLSGLWDVTWKDGCVNTVHLPGTLDENGIGSQDDNSKQWKSEEEGEKDKRSNTLLHQTELISTRLTRAYTYEGVAVYAKILPLSEEFKGRRIFLEAERTRKLSLRINGQEIEAYCQGTVSTPYTYEITKELSESKEEQARIELLCDNSYQGWPHDAIVYSSAATDETQTNWNGILGDLRLRIENEIFISSIRVYPQGTELSVVLELNAAKPYQGTIRLQSASIEQDITQHIIIGAGRQSIHFDHIPLKADGRRWDELDGNLYELVVTGDDLEPREITFGIRDFCGNDDGRFALNGRTIFLRSEANCCVFPGTGHMPLTVEEWLKVLTIYQSYGINCVRFHSHCPPDAAFTAADQLGMLMQPELSHWNPNTAFEDEESWNYYRLELEQILYTYANHPSLVMLTFGNELQTKELGVQRMNELLALAKSIDTTRRYAIGSNNFYGAQGTDPYSDFYTSSNYYDAKIRGTSSPMTGHINECYPNARTDYSKGMEKLRKVYSGPVFSFEVGQYEVLPDFDEIEDFHGVTLPNNLIHIKQQVIKRGFYSDWKQRVEATGELARIAYREEIEAVLRTKELSGISLLGLQDFPGQGTALVGMLNSHLCPKPYPFARPEAFRAFFRPVLPLVLLEKYTYTNQENLSAVIKIANYGKRDIIAPTGYELSDGTEVIADGIFPEAGMPCGELTAVGSLTISLKNIQEPRRLNLKVSIEGNDNEYPIWVYPEEPMKETIEASMKQSVAETTEQPGDIVITANWQDTERELLLGKKVFFSPAAEEAHFPHSAQSQFTTDFWSVGTFAEQSGCMGCLIEAAHPVFAKFPTETHSNWQWWPMTNGRAMLLPDKIKPIVTVMDCYARLRHLACLFECRVGSGRLMVSSMGLLEKQQYPEVRALLRSILNYMNSEEFEPKQTLSVEELNEIIQ